MPEQDAFAVDHLQAMDFVAFEVPPECEESDRGHLKQNDRPENPGPANVQFEVGTDDPDHDVERLEQKDDQETPNQEQDGSPSGNERNRELRIGFLGAYDHTISLRLRGNDA